MNTGIKPAYTTGAHIYPMLIDGTWHWVVEHFELFSDCFVEGKEVSLREESEILADQIGRASCRERVSSPV